VCAGSSGERREERGSFDEVIGGGFVDKTPRENHEVPAAESLKRKGHTTAH